MKYKVIPGPKVVSGSANDASDAFQSIINQNAVDGWKYHSMETITSVQKGCVAPKAQVTSFMLIFYKED